MAEFVISTDLAAIEQTQILANFDEVRAAVAELARPYQGLVVTAEGMKNAAADRAKLRKLRERLDGQRKAVKAACLAPAEAFAKGLAPALEEIDRAVQYIDRQIKELEEVSRLEKITELEAFYRERLTPEIEPYVTFDKLRERHPKWANKGCTVKEAENDILADLANVERGIAALRGYPEQYRSSLLDAFASRFDLGDVVAKYARLKEVEAYEAQREEVRKAQEALRRAQEARRTEEVSVHGLGADAQAEGKDAGESGTEDGNAHHLSPAAAPFPQGEGSEEARSYDFRVWATRAQIGALREFLVGNGIRYGKVPKE